MRTRGRAAGWRWTAAAGAAVVVLLLQGPGSERSTLIVQAGDPGTAAAAVRAAGGRITHELGVIDAVAAELTLAQAGRLRTGCRSCRLYTNAEARLAGDGSTQTGNVETYYPTLVGAAALHAQGYYGTGVTVAVIDTGFFDNIGLLRDHSSSSRLLIQYDAIANMTRNKPTDDDLNGHGAHVSGVAVSSYRSASGLFHGVAPGAQFVSVKAFDTIGRGTYADVIRGINWVVSNKARYNIGVLNCSFSAPVRSWYWEDPLNQAVMRAWQAGIVVVVSAGNAGPLPMTIGVPANVPYVITVGAMTDGYTPTNPDDDRLSWFSSTGPTYEGFVKPDLVAPGGHILSLMDKKDWIPTTFPWFHDGKVFFTMSGTSQAAAVVSGAAALVRQRNPGLSPDDVKCALVATARPAVDPATGAPAYSIFQQGAGRVDVLAASTTGVVACANQGLDIAREFATPPTRYAGPAGQDSTGNYTLLNSGGAGFTWNGVYNGSTGHSWSSGYPWSGSTSWTSGYPWTNSYQWTSSYPWTNGYPWTAGYPWSNSLTESTFTNVWVPQE